MRRACYGHRENSEGWSMCQASIRPLHPWYILAPEHCWMRLSYSALLGSDPQNQTKKD